VANKGGGREGRGDLPTEEDVHMMAVKKKEEFFLKQGEFLGT